MPTPEHTPVIAEILQASILVGHDYDKTIAMTSEPVTGGYTVEEAYELSVEKIFGPEALSFYIASGGLRNRAASQVVDQLASGLGGDERRQRSEDLVASKLEVLTPQIGRRMANAEYWPPLNCGFKHYWNKVGDLKGVSRGVVSSGHSDFILKTFELHELTQPDVMVTDDDMRPLMDVLPRAVCEKPSRLLIDMLASRWLEKTGAVDVAQLELAELQKIITERVIFAGDDPIKDGLTAANAGVEFVHIDPSNPSFSDLYYGVVFMLHKYSADASS